MKSVAWGSRVGTKWLQPLAGLLALTLVLLPLPATALCLASGDPVVEAIAIETDRNPANALRQIKSEIAKTGEDQPRRMAWLRIAHHIASARTGRWDAEFQPFAERTIPTLAPDDPLALQLKLTAIAAGTGDIRQRTLELVPEMERLPAQSAERACASLAIGEILLAAYQPADAFPFVAYAYQAGNAKEDRADRFHALAASTLSQLAMVQGDRVYALELSREALGYFMPHGLHYRAMRDFISVGRAQLAFEEYDEAIRALKKADVQALLAENPMAGAYARGNLCEALLDAGRLDQAQSVCTKAHDDMTAHNWAGEGFTGTLLADLFLQKGQYKRALALLNPVIDDFTNSTVTDNYVIRAYRARASALMKTGQPERAAEDLQFLTERMLEARKEERNTAAAVARARFETEQLRTDLKLEEQDHAAIRDLFGTAAIAGAAVLSLTLGLAWVLARHRRVYRQQALTDPLTGLPNRRDTIQRIENLMARSRAQDQNMVLAVLDLDHFKSCNDTWGHDAGDEALKVFAEVLRTNLGKRDVCGRWGGEEFLIAMADTDLRQARVILGRLRHAAADKRLNLANGYRLRFSAGAVALNSPLDLLDTLVAQADELLYQAKEQGRDRTCFSDEGLGLPLAHEADAPAMISAFTRHSSAA